MTLSTVTLKWDLTDLIEAGLSATLSITPTAQLSDTTDHVLIPAVARRVNFTGGTGQLAGIVANDNAAVLPAGAGYLISVATADGTVIVPQFQTQLNFANGAIQWLDALATVPVVATGQQYLPLPSGTASAGMSALATGSGEASAWGFAGAGATVVVPKPAGATAADTPAVTAAIANLVSALSFGPATLLFQDGTYQADSNSLVIRSVSNFAVRSSGRTVIAQAPNRAGLVNNTGGDIFVIADCTDFTVEGITFDGMRDTVAPLTTLTAAASSGQPSVTVASGQGSRYLAGQKLFLFGGLGTSEQQQSEGFTAAGATSPLTVLSVTPGGGSGGGDLVTFTGNLQNTYTHVGGTAVSDGYGPYAMTGAYLTTYQTGSATVAGRALIGEDQQNGLHLISCKRFRVSNVTARNTWESPIRCGTGYESTSLTDGCSQGAVTGCVCYHGYDQGVAVWMGQNVTVSNCVLTATGWAGVSLTAADYSAVLGCQVVSPVYQVPGSTGAGSGIVTEGGQQNIVAGNVIVSPFQCGIQLIQSPLQWGLGPTLPTLAAFVNAYTPGGTSIQVSSTSSLIAGGLYSILDGQFSEPVTVATVVDSTHVTFAETITFAHNSGASIGTRVASRNVIQGNTIRNAGAQGVLLGPSARNVIQGNAVTGSGQQGIAASYAIGFHPTSAYPSGDGSIIESNIVENCAAACIKTDGIAGFSLIGNRISGPGGFGAGLELHGVTDSMIGKNYITDINGSFGIVIENGGPSSTPSARITVSDNVVRRTGGQPGISVQTGDSLSVTGNQVSSAGGDGIYLQGVTHSVISDNVCNGNQSAGIRVDDNGSTYSQFNRITNNTCRDDGSGYNLFGGGGQTQQHGIVEQGHSNNNLFAFNTVDSNAVDQLVTAGAGSKQHFNIVSGTIQSS